MTHIAFVICFCVTAYFMVVAISAPSKVQQLEKEVAQIKTVLYLKDILPEELYNER